MRRRALPAPGFPPELAAYDPALWIDQTQWAWARCAYWRDHPEVQPFIDPVELLAERRAARLAAHAGMS
jgi:hypothetical protein